MIGLPMRALTDNDEDTLNKSLIELSQIARTEPLFFNSNFGEILPIFIQIMHSNQIFDFSIKNVALEFITTMVTRVSSILDEDKDQVLLKEIFGSIFRYMVDISEEVEDDWKIPESGFKVEDDET